MVPYNTVLSLIITRKKPVFYEIFIENAGFLSIELLQCIGQVRLFLTRNPATFWTAQLDEEVEISSGNVVKVKKGMLFLSFFHSDDDFREKNSFFRLVTHFYENRDEIPENNMKIGENGRISYEFLSENRIKLLYDPISCPYCKGNKIKSIEVSYWILISTEENLLNSFGKCGISRFGEIEANSSNFRSFIIDAEKIENFAEIENFAKIEIFAEIENFAKIEEKREFIFEEIFDVSYITIKARVSRLSEEEIVMFYENIIVKRPLFARKVLYFGSFKGKKKEKLVFFL